MKIIVATDGSEFGQAAVDFTSRIIAQPESAEVKVVCVNEPYAPNEFETLVESMDELADPKNPAAQSAEEVARKAAESLKRAFANLQVTHEVLGGMAARAIVEKAAEWQADLIVLGSHGRGFWSRNWLGSVSDRVAHHAQCAVTIVRR